MNDGTGFSPGNRPRFEDANGHLVGIGDIVQYEYEQGVNFKVIDILQDGDAYIANEANKSGQWVKWVRLAKVPQTVVNPASKVAGYTAQSPEKVALVNGFKADEERLLRKLDALATPTNERGLVVMPWIKNGQWWADAEATVPAADPRWLAIARTKFDEAWMALNRAVFQPQRIKLPEDGE